MSRLIIIILSPNQPSEWGGKYRIQMQRKFIFWEKEIFVKKSLLQDFLKERGREKKR